MAEIEAGQVNALEEHKQQQQRQQPVAAEEEVGAEQKLPAEKTYTQTELDRILGKVRKNARYLGRKEAEAELRAQGASASQARETVQREQQQVPAAPKREDFDTYEEYLEAKSTFNGRQGAKEERAAAEKEATEKRAAEARAKAERDFKRRADEYMKAHPDWAEKVEAAEDVMISVPMSEAIQESAVGPAILEFLIDNPAEAQRISDLSPAAANREIGKIEARIEAKSKKKDDADDEAGDEENDEREDKSADAEGKGEGKDAERDGEGRFKAKDKAARKAPDPIEPGTGRSANQDRGPTDKDSDQGWYAKRLAEERAERDRKRGR